MALKDRITYLANCSMDQLRELVAGYEFFGDNRPTTAEKNTYKGKSRGELIVMVLQLENYELGE